MIREEKHTVRFQGCYFWGKSQVMGYGRLKKLVQEKDTLNKNQILPCWRWLHGLLLFLHRFMHLVFLVMLYHSGRIAIPNYHMFLLLQIMHPVLFKSLQRQGELIISGDSHLVFWWDRYGNLCVSFLNRADLKTFRNVSVAIYFWPIFVCQFWKIFLLVLQKFGDDFVIIGGRWAHF